MLLTLRSLLPANRVQASEAQDSLQAAGNVLYVGFVAAIEAGQDTASGTGIVPATGLLAATDAPDTATATGVVYIAGTAGILEQPDVSGITGTVLVVGAVAATEAVDRFAATDAKLPVAPPSETNSQGAGGARYVTLEKTSRNSDSDAYRRERVAKRLESVIINGKAYDPFTPNLIEILEEAAKAPEPDDQPEMVRQERKLGRTFTVLTDSNRIDVPLFRPLLKQMPDFGNAEANQFEDYAAATQQEINAERRRILMLLTASEWI